MLHTALQYLIANNPMKDLRYFLDYVEGYMPDF